MKDATVHDAKLSRDGTAQNGVARHGWIDRERV
jgi:hypothetical protein